jgi:hypothetical protein
MQNLISLLPSLEKLKAEKAKRSFIDFIKFTKPDYQTNWHHELLANYLQQFAEGKIKKMLVFMPPQHGKSEQVSRRLPAYLLGKNPKLKIIGCSYSSDLATSFNRDVQRIIDDEQYAKVFPDTALNGSNVRTSSKGSYLRNADIFEVVEHKGFYKSVGVSGSLTGTPADIGIIDDPVKDAVEADSITYRARAWDWFTNVFLTRMHNDSQILVTQTRWHEDDLSGRILSKMNKNNDWVVLSLPAIKGNAQTVKEDKRKEGDALWASKHSLERLLEIKDSNPKAFHSLYQQDPKPFSGGLVFPAFKIGWKEDCKIRAYGLDFGYSPDPLALVEIGIEGNNLYLKQLIYETKLDTEQIVSRVYQNVDRGVKVLCDHRSDLIQSLFKKGINAHQAKKGKDSIDAGVKSMQKFNIFVEEGSKDLIKELKYYRYLEDKDGNPIGGKYSETMNHALDACRYAVIDKTYSKESKIRSFSTDGRNPIVR